MKRGALFLLSLFFMITMPACSIAGSAPIEEQAPAYITIGDKQYSTSLTSLSISDANLTDADIVPLRYMKNLTELRLFFNRISDLTPLAGLTNLIKLDLSYNQIHDITPLAGLTNLIEVFLSGNDADDWASVAHVPYVRGMPEPTDTSEIIAKVLARDYQNNWGYRPYIGLHYFLDCQSYLILFLSKSIGFTADDTIVLDTVDMHESLINDPDHAANTSQFVNYRFYVQLADDPDSAVMTFYIDNANLHIHDQHGILLNPDGWPWLDPTRILPQYEIKNSLIAAGALAGGQWYEYHPDTDKMDGNIKIYCYATYEDGKNGEEIHTDYIWINSVTGKWQSDYFYTDSAGL
ncbi:MAG: leucine-rich repeat domain-containing protein [Clostridia bacterium]|nr:leucine-rich repeat domain-containing protein [Clostridia bacterium]